MNLCVASLDETGTSNPLHGDTLVVRFPLFPMGRKVLIIKISLLSERERERERMKRQVDTLPTIDEIKENPEKFIVKTKGWPDKWQGNLLAWFVLELIDKSHLEKITRIKLVPEKRDDEIEEVRYFRFNPTDFNRETNTGRGERIESFKKILIDRFEMSDGGFYQYEDSDGEYYPARLIYHPPFLPDSEIKIENEFSDLLR